MEIDASKLAAAGLTVRFSGPRGTERRIALAPSTGVTGKYASDDDSIRIDAHSREALALAELSWTLESGEVALAGGATLARPVVKLTFPRGDEGTRGEVACGEIEMGGVVVRLDALSQPLHIERLALKNAGIALDGKGAIGIVAEELQAARVAIVTGGTEVVIEGLNLGHVRVHRPRGGAWKIEAKSFDATRIAVDVGELGIVIEDAAVGRVAWKDGGNIELGELEAPKLHVHHRKLGADPKSEGPKSRAEEPKPASKRSRLDLSALDQLNGKLDLDLTADMTVPVLGSRRATHNFRLAVDHGTINYYRLEKSLSTLEDALLDFEVHGKKLALVVDLALTKKTVVSWKLPDDEVELAQQRLVRLRRLIHYELAGGKSDSGNKSSFEVRELLFDKIDIALKMIGGGVMKIGRGTVHFGAKGKSAIGQMQVKGRVCHRPVGPGGTAPEGRLEIAAEKLALGAEDLNIGGPGPTGGGRRLTVQALRVEAIEQTRLAFSGFSPTSLEATIRELGIEQLVVTPPR